MNAPIPESENLTPRPNSRRRAAAQMLVIVGVVMTLFASFIPSISAQPREVRTLERDRITAPLDGLPQGDIRPTPPTLVPPTVKGGSDPALLTELDIRVFLEGSLVSLQTGVNPPLPQMRTTLVDGPAGDLVPATDAENYGLGTTMDANVKLREADDALVDWIKVEVVDASDPSNVVFEASAVVESDGDVMSATSAGEPLRADLDEGIYQLVIRHWSHLPVISPVLTVNLDFSTFTRKLSFDFTGSTVGHTPYGHHQKDMGDGVMAMFAGNANQSTQADEFDINVIDKTIFLTNMGQFGEYLRTDINMNGDVNGDDKGPISNNLGVSGAVFEPTGGVVINEVAPDFEVATFDGPYAATLGWVELHNPTAEALDLSNYVLMNDTESTTIAAGTVLDAGAYLTLREADLTFSLDPSSDSIGIFQPGGRAAIDKQTLLGIAASQPKTLGRCNNATGLFTTTELFSPGAANICEPLDWPQATNASSQTLGPDEISGLVYAPQSVANPETLWAVTDDGTLFIARQNVGGDWEEEDEFTLTASGNDSLDTEGITFASGDTDFMYVATERDSANTAWNAVLRFDVSQVPANPSSALEATHVWDLTDAVPAMQNNKGFEAITWVPDSFLVANRFGPDQGPVYSPGDHPNHGDGLFFMGAEGTGDIYVFALDHVNGTSTPIAAFESGLPKVTGLEFDHVRDELWVLCDDACGTDPMTVLGGNTNIISPLDTGWFAPVATFSKPSSIVLSAANAEGFALTDSSQCGPSGRPFFWAIDSAAGDLRIGTGPC